MSVREYIGARYVPLFADPIQWDNTLSYEPLTVVKNLGSSYVSRRYVPEGIDIENEDYWILWADFNAQIEQYRQEVQTFDGRIDALELKFDEDGKLEANLVITDSITDEAVTTAKIDDEAVTTAKIDDEAVTTAKIDDEAVTTAKIDDEAVTTAKIADGAITYAKIADGVLTKLFKGANIICVTDSWGSENVYNVNTSWMHLVCNALKANYIDLHQGSTGFVHGTTTFKQRLQTYAMNNPTMVNKIDAIFICGSSNDHAYPDATIRTAINDCLDYAAVTYPNALIFFIIQPANDDMNLAGSAISTYNVWGKVIYNNYAAILNYVHPNLIVNDNLIWVLLGHSDAFNTDHVHPNQTGHNLLAEAFMSTLFGGAYNYKQSMFGGAAIGSANYQGNESGSMAVSSSGIVANNAFVQFSNTFDICRMDDIPVTNGNTNAYCYFAIPNLVAFNNQNIPGFGVCYDADGKFAPMEVSLVQNTKQTYTSGTHKQTLVKLDWGRYVGSTLESKKHILHWKIEIPLKYGI